MSFLFVAFIETVLLFGFLSGLARLERGAWWFGVFNHYTLYLMFGVFIGSLSGSFDTALITISIINSPTALMAAYGYWKWGKLETGDVTSASDTATTLNTNLLDEGLTSSQASGNQIHLFSTSEFRKYAFWGIGGSFVYLSIFLFGRGLPLTSAELAYFLYAWSTYLFISFGVVGLYRLANRSQTGWYLVALGGAIRLLGLLLQAIAIVGFHYAYLKFFGVGIFLLVLCWQGKNAWEQKVLETGEIKQLL